MLVKILVFFYFFFFKQKTAYEMRISDWSSDVCSSDLRGGDGQPSPAAATVVADGRPQPPRYEALLARRPDEVGDLAADDLGLVELKEVPRSEERRVGKE